MSPEYEGPQDEAEEGVAPRRVKHLIVLPGGAAPEDHPSDAEVPEQFWSSGIPQGGGASAAVAQLSGAISRGQTVAAAKAPESPKSN